MSKQLSTLIAELKSQTVEDLFDESITAFERARSQWRKGEREAALVGLGDVMGKWGTVLFANVPGAVDDMEKLASAVIAEHFDGVSS